MVAERVLIKMASAGYKNPPRFSEEDYEQWKNEIQVWKLVTDLEKKKQALAVTLTLTGKAKEAALGNTADRLNQDDGMDILIDTLDKLFLRENKDLAYESYMNFDYFKRKDDMNMSKYIIEFDQRYEILTCVFLYKMKCDVNK